ncbi:hypothetical protein DF185_08900 [Marinifilum breve]|uniref:histidine kinase n=2 Tax=Marinifilum breve TaxID=2184082 RepID=A0A2V3ZZ31_9BACT|nr:hypothetical protein DF185_08900 [Marinifilum breve]
MTKDLSQDPQKSLCKLDEKEMNKSNLDHFRGIQNPNSLLMMLNVFSELSGCPCLLMNFEDKYVNSCSCNAMTLFNGGLIKNGESLFGRISEMKSEREDACIEIVYGPHARGVFVPVKIKGDLYGYFVYGQFVEENDPIAVKIANGDKLTNEEALEASLLKVLSREEIEENIEKSIRFAKGIVSQIEMSYELQNEIEKNKQAANEIRVQKTFFENLFENSPDAIAILDNEDKVIRVNKEFEKLFEYTQEEVLSNKINDLIVPENFKEEGKKYTKQASLGQVLEFTTVRQTKYGKQIHVQVTGKPIFLDEEKVAVYAIYRNVTEEVWQQKQEQIIYGITDLLNSALSQVELVHRIGDLLQPVVGNGQMFLDLISPTNRSLRSFSQKSSKYDQISFSESLSFSAIRRKRKLNLDEYQIKEIVDKNSLSLSEFPMRWIGFPLVDNDLVLGVFGVSSLNSSANLDSDTLKLLELVSVQIALGVKRKKREMELKTLHRSMEQSPASIVITNRDGDIEYVNPKFCQISGYSVEEVIGKNPRILKSGFTPQDVYKQMWEHLKIGEEWNCEFLNVKKNKELYWERASFSAIKDEFGKITHYMATKEDITESKRIEKDLLEAKNKAEESDRMKSAFMANVSHELRTPLNAVIGFSNLCNDSMNINEILEFVQLINKSGNQLLEVIEDILNFTMIESGNIKKVEEEFLMTNFLCEVKKLAAQKQILENKERLTLKFNADKRYSRILVRNDFQRLIQVVMNLFKNGLKFTNQGVVEFGYFVDGEKLKIYVKDTGVGIEKDKKDIIFDKFRQVDDSITRTFGGTGMGLAISKKIMDMLGGRIEVESEPNKGSTFTLVLDCIISKEKRSEVELVDANHMPTILVAEDELSNYRLIETILKRNKYKVIWAENGAEAIRICKEKSNIDLVLMDMRMPEVDGMKATTEIKKINPNLTIIAQTAYAMNGDKDKALEIGCDDYLSKPIKKELLLEKIKSFIK